MPGPLDCRTKFGLAQPFKRARIIGSLYMTVQTVILIGTLIALGAEVHWCSCNIFSTKDHAAAAIARDSSDVFTWKGKTLQEYWWYTECSPDWGPDGEPDFIVDDGSDSTLLVHEDVKAEEEFHKTRMMPGPTSTDNVEFQIVLTIFRDEFKADPTKYRRINDMIVSVSEDTTTDDKDIIMVDHMREMKNNAIVCNIIRLDNEIDILGLETYPGVKKITIKPQTDWWVFPETNTGIIVLAEERLMNLGCATGHPSFVMLCSFTNQVIAQLELWNEKGMKAFDPPGWRYCHR